MTAGRPRACQSIFHSGYYHVCSHFTAILLQVKRENQQIFFRAFHHRTQRLSSEHQHGDSYKINWFRVDSGGSMRRDFDTGRHRCRPSLEPPICDESALDVASFR